MKLEEELRQKDADREPDSIGSIIIDSFESNSHYFR